MRFEKLIKTGRRRPLFLPTATTQKVDLERRDIERMLPHRDPFLFVDRISAVDLTERTVVGHRRIDPDDPVLAGHFPGDPVYPGVLLVEMMAQTALCLQHLSAANRVEVHPDDKPLAVRLLRLHHALFISEVRPGDEITVLGMSVEEGGYTATLAGQVLKGDIPCAVSILEAFWLDE